MNIFYLDHNQRICAQMHNNRHCVKMILEYAQLLSTAHRVLDGFETTKNTYVEGSFPARYRSKKIWKLNNSYDSILYQATHINHPSAIWCRENYENYIWLAKLLKELCKEYTHRYGKIHKCEEIGLVEKLQYAPVNIKQGVFTEPTPAMPEEYKVSNDSIKSYRNYYVNSKQHLAEWKNRPQPTWFIEGLLDNICKV